MDEELRYADINPDDMPEDALQQMLAIKQTIDEDGEAIPIPTDSPLGRYLLDGATSLEAERDND